MSGTLGSAIDDAGSDEEGEFRSEFPAVIPTIEKGESKPIVEPIGGNQATHAPRRPESSHVPSLRLMPTGAAKASVVPQVDKHFKSMRVAIRFAASLSDLANNGPTCTARLAQPAIDYMMKWNKAYGGVGSNVAMQHVVLVQSCSDAPFEVALVLESLHTQHTITNDGKTFTYLSLPSYLSIPPVMMSRECEGAVLMAVSDDNAKFIQEIPAVFLKLLQSKDVDAWKKITALVAEAKHEKHQWIEFDETDSLLDVTFWAYAKMHNLDDANRTFLPVTTADGKRTVYKVAVAAIETTLPLIDRANTLIRNTAVRFENVKAKIELIAPLTVGTESADVAHDTAHDIAKLVQKNVVGSGPGTSETKIYTDFVYNTIYHWTFVLEMGFWTGEK
jgi:hypothetical protein